MKCKKSILSRIMLAVAIISIVVPMGVSYASGISEEDYGTITFDIGMGTISEKPEDITEIVGTQINLDEVPTPSDVIQETYPPIVYSFQGWYDSSSNQKVSGIIDMPQGGLNLVAKWEVNDDVKYGCITFDINFDGHKSDIEPIIAQVGTLVDIDAVPKPGIETPTVLPQTIYTFKGWTNKKGGSSVSGKIEMPEGVLELQAEWDIKVTPYEWLEVKEPSLTLTLGEYRKMIADGTIEAEIIKRSGVSYHNNFEVDLDYVREFSVDLDLSELTDTSKAGTYVVSIFVSRNGIPEKPNEPVIIYIRLNLEENPPGYFAEKLIANDIRLSLADYKKMVANGTIQSEIIARSKAAYYNQETGKSADVSDRLKVDLSSITTTDKAGTYTIRLAMDELWYVPHCYVDIEIELYKEKEPINETTSEPTTKKTAQTSSVPKTADLNLAMSSSIALILVSLGTVVTMMTTKVRKRKNGMIN